MPDIQSLTYRVPYVYDEADDAYPVKYLNDLPCDWTALHVQHEGHAGSGIPLWGDISVTAAPSVHKLLATLPDVHLLP